ncbi:hypothetical protein [Leeuwenhoekiella nanhaiensis]|uniref:Uncharacterized protein n=1 Tax=Leeuwenhoekiella nanhaiensis TaxID=1655491 RepID=A0A2G1VVT0_9FLAO|nr:hypothetical protein [Leeuwenhoekiella nanhaiensis]PHQ30886.1 hypothetical protein CJ305_01270 [Leeuwenhoekiella nanhaiensis]
MEKIYFWKYLINDKYEISTAETRVEIHSVINSEDFKKLGIFHLTKFFINSYDIFQIPEDIDSKIEELLQNFSIGELKRELLIYGCSLQSQFAENYNILKDDLLEDFDLEYKEFKKLLAVLRSYLFADNLKNLPTITFKTFSEGNVNIKNFFVIKDIYEAICEGFDLKKENFEERSRNLLEMTNRIKVEKYSEKVKVDFIRCLYDFLTSLGFENVNALKFIGVFFKLFQIQLNNNEDELEIYDNLEDNLKSIDLKNLTHYIKRPPNFSYY